MPRHNNRGRVHQVWWSDLKPWVEQLYEDHRVYLDVRVHLFAEVHQMRPTVEVRAYRVREGRLIDELMRETTVFCPEDQGHVESIALRMVSGILLTLENEKAEAERQAVLWPA